MQVLDQKITSLRYELQHYQALIMEHQTVTGHTGVVDDCYICHYWEGMIGGLRMGLAVLGSGE